MSTNDTCRGELKSDTNRHRGEGGPWDGSACAEGSGQERADTTRAFALWMLAHYTSRPDDTVQVASHGGLAVSGGAGMVKRMLRIRCNNCRQFSSHSHQHIPPVAYRNVRIYPSPAYHDHSAKNVTRNRNSSCYRTRFLEDISHLISAEMCPLDGRSCPSQHK